MMANFRRLESPRNRLPANIVSFSDGDRGGGAKLSLNAGMEKVRRVRK
jgi:hypothetical protein